MPRTDYGGADALDPEDAASAVELLDRRVRSMTDEQLAKLASARHPSLERAFAAAEVTRRRQKGDRTS